LKELPVIEMSLISGMFASNMMIPDATNELSEIESLTFASLLGLDWRCFFNF
jgi:hypothetical protein